MASDVTRLIGIDFGTSTSVVCVKRYKDGEPIGGAFQSSSVTFGDGQGDTRAYTVARLNADGTYTCGRAAEDAGPEAQIFREFKMDLESPDKAKSAQAKALTEEFFKYLYRWYDHQRSNLGEAGDKERTVVSFPAKWSEGTRSFMVEAAKKAGFPNVSAMDEPSAALYATLTQNMNDASAKGLLRAGEPGYMLLVDMGAGTTDLAVCRYTVDAGASGFIRAEQIKNEIVSTWPEAAGAPTCGGREVDRVLEEYLTDYLTSCGLDASTSKQLVCGSASVKSWKETTVSPRLNEETTVDSCGFLSGYMAFLPKKLPFPPIDRAKLERLLKTKLDDFKSLVTGCLDKAAKLEPAIAQNGVDLVVLTGGHSAWYFTEALLNGTMPGIRHPALKRAQTEKTRVLRLSNPQETVALGLVYSMLPMKVEKGGDPYLQRLQALGELAREYVRLHPGRTVPPSNSVRAYREILAEWGFLPETVFAVWPDSAPDRRDGFNLSNGGITFRDDLITWDIFVTDEGPAWEHPFIIGLREYLRKGTNFLWRYDESERPKWPDVSDQAMETAALYFIRNHGLQRTVLISSQGKPLSGTGVRVNNKVYTWRDLMEKDLGAAPGAVLDLQSYLRFLLRLDDPTRLHWPEVSAAEYADLAQYMTDILGWRDENGPVPPFVRRSQAEPLVRKIMEKWRMCPDQPVFGVAPDVGEGFIFCRDGFCGLDGEPMSWETFLEMDISETSELKPLQGYLRDVVHYRWEGAKAPVWPNVSDGVIGALMRIYASGHMKNAYLPTARELPYFEETVRSLRSRHQIPPDENIIAVRPDKEEGLLFTEKGVYATASRFTWRGVVEDDKVPETGLVHDVQVYLRGLLQYKRAPQSPQSPQSPQPPHTQQPPRAPQPQQPAKPEAPVTAYTVTVTRKKQFSGAVMIMCLQVDGGNTQNIGFGETVRVTLAPGRHTFTFWMNGTPGRKFPIQFNAERDMDLIAEVGGMPDFVISLKEIVGK